MSSSGPLITLNISSVDVRVLEVRGGKVRAWGDAPLEPGMVRDGRIIKPTAVAAVIDAIFTRLKLPRDSVLVSLSGMSFTYRVIEMPDVNRSMLLEAMERSAAREIPVPLEELYLTWQPVGSHQDPGPRTVAIYRRQAEGRASRMKTASGTIDRRDPFLEQFYPALEDQLNRRGLQLLLPG